MRRKAKTINFGIIYGISPFGLANQLRIDHKEATQYIDNYFKKYPEIKKYMEEVDSCESSLELWKKIAELYKKGLTGIFGFFPEEDAKNSYYRWLRLYRH